ncbi:MAG TPA: methylated-DNA--[protein]-cysteine S-methyltransferase [Acetobacteraceae bacterium]|nr:methylated-DNA--[protein]-cysteine S-methyltransferase [Acetobacteraceae bacterium]
MGLTQAALAEAMEVQRKHVNGLRSDRQDVTAPTALILSRLFRDAPSPLLTARCQQAPCESKNRKARAGGWCYAVPVMPDHGFAVFSTAIGSCGIAWGPRGVTGVQLPDRTAQATRDLLRRRHPNAVEAPPPPDIQQVIDAIVGLLRGEARDLSGIALDMADIPRFRQRLYASLRGIRAGATISYGELATRLGDGCTARDVGEAMGQNPFPIIVPCHRVLAAGGRMGGFSAPGGVATKLRMLEIEGARIGEAPTLFANLPLMAPRRRK